MENKPTFIKEMSEKRIMFVNYMLNTDGKLLSYRQLMEMYGRVAVQEHSNLSTNMEKGNKLMVCRAFYINSRDWF